MSMIGPHPQTPSPGQPEVASYVAGEGETRVRHQAPRAWLRAWWATLSCLALLAGCGGGDDDIDIIPNPGTATVASTPSVVAETTPAPAEFKVAFINLMSPISLDSTNTTAMDTCAARLQLVVDQLKEFKPDLAAFSEVTETQGCGSAKEILAHELKMEPQYIRAKPWIPGATKEINESIKQSLGFGEGELILVNSNRFPAVGDAELVWLNPRTSDVEGPAGIWMKLKGPATLGVIDVFLSHLTGTDPRTRAQQAADFARFIKAKRGPGPAIVFGDFGDPPDSATQKAFLDLGLSDVLVPAELKTCCREGVVGEQTPPASRTDYILTSGWGPSSVGLFAHEAQQLQDGALLFASDHNGVTAVFPIGQAPPP